MATTESVAQTAGGGGGAAAQATQRLEVHALTRLWRSAITVLGGAAAFAIVWAHPDRGVEDGWYGWAALGTFLGVVSGSGFGSGIARWRDVVAVQRVSLIRVLPAVLSLALTASAALVLAGVVVDQGVTWHGLTVAGLAITGALPAGAAMMAVRVLAVEGLHGSGGRQLAGLIRLRRLLTRLQSIFGSLVLFLTLFTAAKLNWGTGERVPASIVFYTGAAAAAVVALIYMPTAALLRRRCSRFIEELFPLDGVQGSALVQAAEDRLRVEAILGLDRTTLGELQAGLIIVLPLLASAGLTLLPGF